VDSQLVISKNGVGMSSILDIVQDSYNNVGFSDMSISVKSYDLI
jgi:hypothetical protein